MRSRQLELEGLRLRGAGEGLRKVPELTLAMRIALEAIELCAGEPFCGRQFRRPGGDPYQITAGILRKLLREGLIEVMELGPAVYRLTKLGRVARSLG
jgi:hypothetical protein